ncbi:MAG: hypothetical protein ACXVY3_10000 [Gaiellaceae bacterium]
MEPEDVIRFESLDDGAQVLAFAHATAEGRVALALAHELDGDLELCMNPEIAERLAERLSRAAREAERGDD